MNLVKSSDWRFIKICKLHGARTVRFTKSMPENPLLRNLLRRNGYEKIRIYFVSGSHVGEFGCCSCVCNNSIGCGALYRISKV